jgi:hypothetical protein
MASYGLLQRSVKETRVCAQDPRATVGAVRFLSGQVKALQRVTRRTCRRQVIFRSARTLQMSSLSWAPAESLPGRAECGGTLIEGAVDPDFADVMLTLGAPHAPSRGSSPASTSERGRAYFFCPFTEAM